MGKVFTPEVMPSVDAEYKSAIDQYIGEIKIIQVQMNKDQREIEMLRAETDVALASIMQTLKAVRSK